MTSKRSHPLIKLVNGHLNSTECQFTKIAYAYNVTHLMVDKNLKLLTNGETHFRDKGDVRFYLSARVVVKIFH